jgi:hypothetical protein
MPETYHGYRILRSGDLSLLYRNGEIRQVCLGRVQVLNAIYAAVRDQNWTTIPFTVDQEKIEVTPDGFTIEASLKYFLERIHYLAQVTIMAKANQLEFKYKGVAGSSFLRNRIGICILHSIKECRGKQVTITHPDCTHSQGRFPELISPDQPFFNITGMSWNPGKGIAAVLSFEGEVFESEDQRNWTDASYKTYCTPLALPFPVTVEKGEQVDQSVTLVVDTKSESSQPPASYSTLYSLPEKKILTLYPGKTSPLPGLGIGRTTEAGPLTAEELENLSALPFDHYRVDLHLARDGWKEDYDSAASEQRLLGWPLELALHFGDRAKKELDAFLEHYNLIPVKIRHLLVFDRDFLSSRELLKQVVPGLKTLLPDIPVGGGTDAHFAELNRNPPDQQLLDFITYSICPQIHAFDNLTLLENLEAQSDSVSSAMSLLDKPVTIGALTLKQRFNAVATEDEDEIQALPESDPRQHTSFAAGWTLGSIRNLALAGAASLTYFETVGPRGILSRPDAPLAHSPLYRLFEEILTGNHLHVIHSKSSHPLEFDCLALQGQKEVRLLLANYTESELSIEMAVPPGIPRKLTLSPSLIFKITYAPVMD